MSWAAIAKTATAPAAPTGVPAPTADERVAVVDTNAIISGLRLEQLADRFCTIPEVLAEVRDKQARTFLSTLPFSLDVREPSDDSVKAVQRFARETGDIHSLSAVDLKLLALAHTLEIAAHGSANLREHPVQVRTRQRHKTRPRVLPGWGQVTNPEDWRVVDEAPQELLSNAPGGQSRIIAAVQSLTLGEEESEPAATAPPQQQEGQVQQEQQQQAAGWGGSLPALPLPPPRQQQQQPAEEQPAQAAVAAAAGQEQVQQQAVGEGAAAAAAADKGTEEGDEEGDEEDGDGWETVSKSRNAARRRQRKDRRRQAWQEQQQQQQPAPAQQQQQPAQQPKGEEGSGCCGKASEMPAAAAKQDKEAAAAGRQQQQGQEQQQDGSQSEQDDEEGEEEDEDEETGEMEEVEGYELITEEGDDDDEEGEESEAGTAAEVATTMTDAGATEAGATDAAGTASELVDELLPNTTSNVFCVTADFAMQNVMLQMGLRLVTRDGKQITRVSRWALRCSACFFVTKEAGRLFCPRCGNMTLDKVEVTVGPDGAEFFGVRKKFILRGTRFSLPKPRGGRGARKNPILREDVLLARTGGRMRQKSAAAASGEVDPFAPEYGSETWHAAGGGGRGGGRGLPVLQTSWRHNPNEAKPQRKSRRK
ncbi:hypothetical protein Agub_g315 [Astrephomene gubernaculifera]|uniref:RNA-binding protein NOB1 n=1 Tax=Astrephomene gubernaculifera TaxID=47775 RepID=A0AAD3DG94_9CHLO|nr:hypothetical protein Agub_g315 [Astrephomene gubernaculifera]